MSTVVVGGNKPFNTRNCEFTWKGLSGVIQQQPQPKHPNAIKNQQLFDRSQTNCTSPLELVAGGGGGREMVSSVYFGVTTTTTTISVTTLCYAQGLGTTPF